MGLKSFVKERALKFLLGEDKKRFLMPLSYSELIPQSHFTSYNSYLTAAQKISWVYKCVSIISEGVAMTDHFIFDGDEEEVKDASLDLLLAKPNDLMTWFEFKEGMVWYLLLSGNCYVLKDETNMLKQPTKLWLMRPDRMKVVPSKSKIIAGYQYELDGVNYPFEREQIIHIKLPNPTDSFVGMGKIQAAEMTYNTEIAASTYNWNFFENAASPSGILSNEGKMDDDSFSRLQQQFEARHKGWKKMQKPLFLEQGTQYKQMGLSQNDMAFMEQRKFSREEILSMFGVPPAKAGILEYASYANVKEQEMSYRKDTLKPMLTRLQDKLTNDLIVLFDPDWKFEFEEVAQRDEELYLKLATQGINSGLLTPNEARTQYLEMPIVENEPAMESYYLPLNLMPITGEPAKELNAAQPPIEPPKEPTKELKKKEIDLKGVNLRQMLLKISVLTRKRYGIKVKKDMKKYFAEQEKEVMDKVDNIKSVKKLPSNFLGEEANRKLQEVLNKSHVLISIQAIENIDQLMNTDADPSLNNPILRERLGKLGKKVKEINETTLDKLDETLTEGIDAGESIPDLRKRVENVYAEAKGYRSVMIARTEAAHAYDQGAIIGYESAGVEYLDVIGCEDDEIMPGEEYGCNSTHIPIEEADSIEFHPNHSGTFVPEL